MSLFLAYFKMRAKKIGRFELHARVYFFVYTYRTYICLCRRPISIFCLERLRISAQYSIPYDFLKFDFHISLPKLGYFS